VQVVLLYNDITELMEAKAAVSREKELIYQTLASIAEGVISTDKKGRVSLMNHVAEQLTGWSSSKAIGRPLCDVLKIFSEDDRNICLDVLDNVLLEERKEWVGRGASLQSYSGQKLPFAMSAASIRGQDGKEVMGSIVVFRDVTQEKKLEEEIAKRSRMESIGLLAGGIAHDFNNLLTAMLGNVSLAKMLVDRDGQIFELLSQAEMASTRARSLTQQLLTFAKGGKPVKCPVSLAPLLRECSGFTMSGFKVRCELELADELWDLELDKGQFGQVIQNLLLNAIQAMPKGGVVRVAAQNRAVRKESEEATLLPGKYVLITVRDQGTGIAPDNINRIFDPYYSTKETGHGLGLAICYSIIKNHHGAITVESEPGLGSTFSILLPAINHSAQATDPESAATVSTKRENKEKRVLIMDDETMICQVAVAMFKSLGWVAESCHDGKAAIVNYSEALAQGQPYDLVLMDLTIPGGMGGHETIAELLALYPDASVLASSGYTNDPIMSDFSSYGFKGVLPKPYTMEMLTKALEKLLVA
jgi:PAS domain S-box-containing protein